MKVNVAITVEPVKAKDYKDAAAVAFKAVHWYLKARLNVETLEEFVKASRVHKNTDGTFTVTIP